MKALAGGLLRLAGRLLLVGAALAVASGEIERLEQEQHGEDQALRRREEDRRWDEAGLW